MSGQKPDRAGTTKIQWSCGSTQIRARTRRVIVCAGDNNGYTYNFKIHGRKSQVSGTERNGTIDSTTDVYVEVCENLIG
ncbi:MAG: hypothetical protein IPM86_06400 [Saprospiraceae bacterium]|nr:hypothetical protein [Saprospiraceae bacterium]